MPGPPPKPAGQRRRRNKREEVWTLLPSGGCELPVPEWPLSRKASKPEAAYWSELWSRPVAWWWHDQAISPFVIARYVRMFCRNASDPTKLGAQLTTAEKNLGLSPEGMRQLRLMVEDEASEAEVAEADEPGGRYQHLRVVDETG